MQIKTIRQIIIFLLINIGIGSNSYSQSKLVEELSSTIEKSTNVVRGTVIKFESKRTHDGKSIYTNCFFQVRQNLFGDVKANLIIVKLLGGTVEGITTIVLEAPVVKQNEEAILFLKMNQNVDSEFYGKYDVANLTDGKYDIIKDIYGNEYVQKSISVADNVQGKEIDYIIPKFAYPVNEFISVLNSVIK